MYVERRASRNSIHGRTCGRANLGRVKLSPPAVVGQFEIRRRSMKYTSNKYADKALYHRHCLLVFGHQNQNMQKPKRPCGTRISALIQSGHLAGSVMPQPQPLAVPIVPLTPPSSKRDLQDQLPLLASRATSDETDPLPLRRAYPSSKTSKARLDNARE